MGIGRHQGSEKKHDPVKKNTGKAVAAYVLRAIVALLVFAVVLTNVFTHILQVVNYNGTGMEPGMRGGQTLLLLKTQDVQEGDIIAFYYNNQVLVRRVICLGGKQLEISKEGDVRINEVLLNEPYVRESSLGQCNITFPYNVRTGTVFVMGDNRSVSMDSRLQEIGTIPTDRIIGKVILAI